MVGIPLLRGRNLTEDDRRGNPTVALINQSFANRFFPGSDPIGQRFGTSVESKTEWLTIVGVVPDRPNLGNKENLGPEAYLSARQFAPTWASTVFLVRTSPNPMLLRESLRGAVQAVDRNVPVGNPVALNTQIERAMHQNSGAVRAIGAIGVFGLALATIGIYGVVAFFVADRTRELGIRTALGASRRDTIRFIARQGLRPVAFGLAAGAALGLVITYGMRESLYGTHLLDLFTYGAIGFVVLTSSAAAILIPARRALRGSPVKALRYE